MNLNKKNLKDGGIKTAGVLAGLVGAALVKKFAPVKFSNYINLGAGLVITAVAGSDFAQSFGSAHAAVGAIDTVRSFVPTVPYLPQVNGLKGLRGTTPALEAASGRITNMGNVGAMGITSEDMAAARLLSA